MTTVLFVCDDLEYTGRVRRGFADAELNLIATPSPFQAMQFAASEVADVLLCDRGLEREDGLAVCQRIMALHGDAPPTALLLDNEYDPQFLGTAISAGTAGVVAKSDSIEELVIRLRSLLDPCAINEPPTRRAYAGQMERRTDPVTGASDQDYLERRLAGEWLYAYEHESPLSLLMIEPVGHALMRERCGPRYVDRAMARAVAVINGELRTRDTVARYEDGTFAVVLSDTGIGAAREFARFLRHALKSTEYGDVDRPVRLEFATGVAEIREGALRGPDELIEKALEELHGEETAKAA